MATAQRRPSPPEYNLHAGNVMRTRSKWRSNRKSVNLEENATALAYICWQIALARTKNLHQQDFHYDDDDQRTGVIAEYLCFLVHVADRVVFDLLDTARRESFVATLAHVVARHYQRNLEDVYGHGRDYGSGWIDTLNTRVAEYGDCKFGGGAPGYEMLRGLGRHVQDVMGESQTNRWVIDQIMEIEAPDAVGELKKGIDNLFGSASLMNGATPPDA